MCGNETSPHEMPDATWYDLVDPETDQVVGQLTRHGKVRSDDPDIEQRVRDAFNRELLIRDGTIAEDLGVCFAHISAVGPQDAAHHDLVFRNLGLLTGLIPAHRRDSAQS